MSDDEEFFDGNNSALFILAAVAEEFRLAEIIDSRKKLSVPKKRRISPLSQHGSAWTDHENLLLRNAYEQWQKGDNDEEIQKWKQKGSLKDRSFPSFVFQKHFSKSRTLTGVRKHFFKLKKNWDDNSQETLIKISIPKRIWIGDDEEEDDDEEDYSDETSSVEEKNREERAFLKISNNSLKRRRRQMSVFGDKKHSKEIEFRQIVENAQNAIWN